VNSENKELFTDLYVRYLLEDSVTQQFEAFKKGFDDVCKGTREKGIRELGTEKRRG
jgi:hypothetical protein